MGEWSSGLKCYNVMYDDDNSAYWCETLLTKYDETDQTKITD